MGTVRVEFGIVKDTVERILVAHGTTPDDAAICSDIIATNSLEGVSSHGLTRFPNFVETIDKGLINLTAAPKQTEKLGAIERWDGDRGLGPVVARHSMLRAMELAGAFGIGCVALNNTTHWLRGGTYGQIAAQAGFAAICWTNARPGMPAWGGTKLRLGNNPIVFALPADPPVVADLALSQFSFGKIQEASMAGRDLPTEAGYGLDGKLTRNPDTIIEALNAGAYRLLPTGLWKGAAMAFTLDAMAATMAGGYASREVETESPADIGICQVFIAIDNNRLNDADDHADRMRELVAFLKQGNADDEPEDVRFPGESVARMREENSRLGVPVDTELWERIGTL